MADETISDEMFDTFRRELFELMKANPLERPALEAQFGQVWDTKQLVEEFNVHGFLAPFVGVTRKSDGKKGSLLFQHLPRYYFDFKEE